MIAPGRYLAGRAIGGPYDGKTLSSDSGPVLFLMPPEKTPTRVPKHTPLTVKIRRIRYDWRPVYQAGGWGLKLPIGGEWIYHEEKP